MRKLKTTIITLVVLSILLGCGFGAWRFFGQNSEQAVKVYSFDMVGMTEYWGDTRESYGPVTTDRIQTIYLTDTQTVSEILVEEGQPVKKGDLLMTFDTTLSQLALERKGLEIQNAELDLEEAERRLQEINWMKPMSTPPETEPTEPNYGRPLSGSFETFRDGHDGSSRESAFICWLANDKTITKEFLQNVLGELVNIPDAPEDPTQGTDPTETQPGQTEPSENQTEATAAPTETSGVPEDTVAPEDMLLMGNELLIYFSDLITEETQTEATTEATAEATAEATTEATAEATAEATTEATAEATAEPTEEASTEAPTDPGKSEAVQAVEAAIAALPELGSLNTGDSGAMEALAPQVEHVWAAYEALAAEEQALVTGAEKLIALHQFFQTYTPAALTDLYVGGVSVNATGYYPIIDGAPGARQDTAPNGGYIYYDAEAGVLTLKDAAISRTASYEGVSYTVYGAGGQLTIRLEGTSTIQGGTYGVYHSGGLTIMGSGSLNASGSRMAVYGSSGVYVSASVARLEAQGSSNAISDRNGAVNIAGQSYAKPATMLVISYGQIAQVNEKPTDPTNPTDSTNPTNPTDPTDPTDPTEETQPGEDGQCKPYYVIFKITENNMSRGETIVWQGVYVNEDGGIRFFDARSMEDFSLEQEEEPETEPYVDYIGSGYTYSQIVELRKEQTQKIKDLELTLRMAQAEYKIMERELSDGKIYAEVDGKILSVLSEEEAKQTQQPVLKVSGGGGYYVEASISELERDSMEVSQEVTINDWNSGMTYTGVITAIGDLPSSSRGYNGMDNPNSTSYPFTVFVDESADLQAGNYVSVQYSAATAQNGIYLQKAFLRTVDGRSFVYVMGEDGLLEERTVTTGKSLWGSYTEILDGLTKDDMVAFPYGKNVRPGVPAEEGTINDLYGY